MNNKADINFSWLFQWFHSQCDGDWEHGNGVHITTLDLPGWKIEININETELQDVEFEKLAIHRSENDWIICEKKKDFFEGSCGPLNLSEFLQIFRQWSESYVK